MTISEMLANAYDNDGLQWYADISLAVSGMILPTGSTHLEDACEAVGVEWRHTEGDCHRYEFADGSAIVTASGAWDIGHAGERLECVCWPDAYHGGHADDCPEK